MLAIPIIILVVLASPFLLIIGIVSLVVVGIALLIVIAIVVIIVVLLAFVGSIALTVASPFLLAYWVCSKADEATPDKWGLFKIFIGIFIGFFLVVLPVVAYTWIIILQLQNEAYP